MRNFSYEQKWKTYMDIFIAKLRYGRITRELSNNGVVLEHKKICDVGCWYNANFLTYMWNKERTLSLSGVDIDVNPKIKHKIWLSLANLETDRFDFNDETFDIVTSLAVIEHLNNPHNYLREITRVLKKWGIFLMTTPSVYAKPVLETFARIGISTKEEVFDHKIYYTKSSLHKLISRYFKNFKIKYFQLWMNIILIAKK